MRVVCLCVHFCRFCPVRLAVTHIYHAALASILPCVPRVCTYPALYSPVRVMVRVMSLCSRVKQTQRTAPTFSVLAHHGQWLKAR
jgi:hypothetical protein